MNKTKGPRLRQQPRAKDVTPNSNLGDTLIIRALWRSVKRFAAGMGCIFAALATMLFFCAPIENDWSWSGSLALTITAAWLCRMCYKYAAGEEGEGDDEFDN